MLSGPLSGKRNGTSVGGRGTESPVPVAQFSRVPVHGDFALVAGDAKGNAAPGQFFADRLGQSRQALAPAPRCKPGDTASYSSETRLPDEP